MHGGRFMQVFRGHAFVREEDLKMEKKHCEPQAQCAAINGYTSIIVLPVGANFFNIVIDIVRSEAGPLEVAN